MTHIKFFFVLSDVLHVCTGVPCCWFWQMLLFLGVYVLGLSVQIVQLNLIRAFLDLAQTGARLKKTQPRHASAEIKKKNH